MQAQHHAKIADLADPSLVIVDDDEALSVRLARAMESRGFQVRLAHSVQAGLELIARAAPAFAVVDLRLGDGSGLDIISALAARRPEARVLVLTGYGNFQTVVSAVKMGAVDYIAKPADADEITDALLAAKGAKAPPPAHPMDPDDAQWEHILHVFEACDKNVSQAARQLSMHRRTLQRILARHSRSPDPQSN